MTLALLEEGVRLNPTSAELEFSLGQLALHSLKDSARAGRAFAAAHAKCKPEPGEAGEDAASYRDASFFTSAIWRISAAIMFRLKAI